MTIGISIATYYRSDGSTIDKLSRCLKSIAEQTDQDYKVILIGDLYEDEDELYSFETLIPEGKLQIVNLFDSYERIRWTGFDLWTVASVTPRNYSIDLFLEQGINYVCHIDDDDYYLPDHIETIRKAINDTGSNFIHTLCNTIRDEIGYKFIFPEEGNELYQEVLPICGGLANCSVCINYKEIKVRPRRVIEEEGYSLVADCDQWNRIGQLGVTAIKVNKVTVVNDDAQSIIRYFPSS